MHVWRLDLSPTRLDLGAAGATLSPEERARADRFRFDRDRERFVAARGTLRRVLGRYAGAAADELRFVYSADGKPSLAGRWSWLRFNLAHSGDLALIAVARGREVGVDVERVPTDGLVADVVKVVCSGPERARLHRLRPSGQRRGFARLWTRKEALIKADGRGLGMSLIHIDVSGRGSRPRMLDESTGRWVASPRWRLRAVRVGGSYAGAVAAEGDGWHILLHTVAGSVAENFPAPTAPGIFNVHYRQRALP
ncbi:MAG TPA: 4'-phosphopantetheinyl transferase superfamily protein [Gemmatimonadales bacterium]